LQRTESLDDYVQVVETKSEKICFKCANNINHYRQTKTYTYYIKLRLKLFYLLGGPHCKHCGCRCYDVLQLDHINDDGEEDWKRFPHRYSPMVSYYLKHPEEAKRRLQVLCIDCNYKKRRKNK
jgi:hypothetical protein